MNIGTPGRTPSPESHRAAVIAAPLQRAKWGKVTHVYDVWRERAVRAGLVLMLVSSGALVLMDFLYQMRVGRIGLYILALWLGITVKREISRRLSSAWDAGERAGQRHAKLEAATEPKLQVVRDMARPR